MTFLSSRYSSGMIMDGVLKTNKHYDGTKIRKAGYFER